MVVQYDYIYSIYTKESVKTYLTENILNKLPEAAATAFLRLLDCYYDHDCSSVEWKNAHREATASDARKMIRQWISLRLVRKQGAHTLIVEGEALTKYNKVLLVYKKEAQEVYALISHYRPVSGAEIAYMLQYKERTRTNQKEFLEGIKKVLDKVPEANIQNLLKNACDERNAHKVEKNIRSYALAIKIIDIFGQGESEPSEKQLEYASNWINEYGFTEEEIIMFAKADYESPTFEYLDGILKNIHEALKTLGIKSVEEVNGFLLELKNINKSLGVRDFSQTSLLMYQKIREEYDSAVIKLAINECVEENRQGLFYVRQQLEDWKTHDLETEDDIRKALNTRNMAKELLHKLYRQWYGVDLMPEIKTGDIKYAEKWLSLNIPEELILHGATYATEANEPIKYLNKILLHYKRQRIGTVSDAEKDKQQHKEQTLRDVREKENRGKRVPAQDYEQRSYAGENLVAEARFSRMILEDMGRTREEAIRESIACAKAKAKGGEEMKAVEELEHSWIKI